MRTTKSILIMILLITGITFSSYSDPLSTMDHDFNPALLSVGNRKVLEVGMSFNTGIFNNYFGLDNVLVKDVVLDLNDMNDIMGENGMILGGDLSINSHAVLTILGLSVGGYGGVNMLTSGNAPGELFSILADGLSVNESLKDESSLYSRVFYESGIYAGWRMDDYQFGIKMGSYVPLIYTDNANIKYNYSSNQADGTITATADVSIPVYSYFDLDAISDDSSTAVTDLFSGDGAGFKIDLGAIKVKKGKPLYGVSLTGLVLSPAIANYKNDYTGQVSVVVDNLATNIEDTDSLITQNSDVELTSSSVSKEIWHPVTLGGFYRFDGLPLIDFIGEAELVFDDPFMYALILDVEGSIWPLSWFSANIGWDKVAWKSGLGFRMNIRILEIGLEVGLASPNLDTLFTKTGATAGFFIACGF